MDDKRKQTLQGSRKGNHTITISTQNSYGVSTRGDVQSQLMALRSQNKTQTSYMQNSYAKDGKGSASTKFFNTRTNLQTCQSPFYMTNSKQIRDKAPSETHLSQNKLHSAILLQREKLIIGQKSYVSKMAQDNLSSNHQTPNNMSEHNGNRIGIYKDSNSNYLTLSGLRTIGTLSTESKNQSGEILLTKLNLKEGVNEKMASKNEQFLSKAKRSENRSQCESLRSQSGYKVTRLQSEKLVKRKPLYKLLSKHQKQAVVEQLQASHPMNRPMQIFNKQTTMERMSDFEAYVKGLKQDGISKMELSLKEMNKTFQKTADLFEDRSMNENFFESYVNQIHQKSSAVKSIKESSNASVEENSEADPYNMNQLSMGKPSRNQQKAKTQHDLKSLKSSKTNRKEVRSPNSSILSSKSTGQMTQSGNKQQSIYSLSVLSQGHQHGVIHGIGHNPTDETPKLLGFSRNLLTAQSRQVEELEDQEKKNCMELLKSSGNDTPPNMKLFFNLTDSSHKKTQNHLQIRNKRHKQSSQEKQKQPNIFTLTKLNDQLGQMKKMRSTFKVDGLTKKQQSGTAQLTIHGTITRLRDEQETESKQNDHHQKSQMSDSKSAQWIHLKDPLKQLTQLSYQDWKTQIEAKSKSVINGCNSNPNIFQAKAKVDNQLDSSKSVNAVKRNKWLLEEKKSRLKQIDEENQVQNDKWFFNDSNAKSQELKPVLAQPDQDLFTQMIARNPEKLNEKFSRDSYLMWKQQMGIDKDQSLQQVPLNRSKLDFNDSAKQQEQSKLTDQIENPNYLQSEQDVVQNRQNKGQIASETPNYSRRESIVTMAMIRQTQSPQKQNDNLTTLTSDKSEARDPTRKRNSPGKSFQQPKHDKESERSQSVLQRITTIRGGVQESIGTITRLRINSMQSSVESSGADKQSVQTIQKQVSQYFKYQETDKIKENLKINFNLFQDEQKSQGKHDEVHIKDQGHNYSPQKFASFQTMQSPDSPKKFSSFVMSNGRMSFGPIGIVKRTSQAFSNSSQQDNEIPPTNTILKNPNQSVAKDFFEKQRQKAVSFNNEIKDASQGVEKNKSQLSFSMLRADSNTNDQLENDQDNPWNQQRKRAQTEHERTMKPSLKSISESLNSTKKLQAQLASHQHLMRQVSSQVTSEQTKKEKSSYGKESKHQLLESSKQIKEEEPQSNLSSSSSISGLADARSNLRPELQQLQISKNNSHFSEEKTKKKNQSGLSGNLFKLKRSSGYVSRATAQYGQDDEVKSRLRMGIDSSESNDSLLTDSDDSTEQTRKLEALKIKFQQQEKEGIVVAGANFNANTKFNRIEMDNQRLKMQEAAYYRAIELQISQNILDILQTFTNKVNVKSQLFKQHIIEKKKKEIEAFIGPLENNRRNAEKRRRRHNLITIKNMKTEDFMKGSEFPDVFTDNQTFITFWKHHGEVLNQRLIQLEKEYQWPLRDGYHKYMSQKIKKCFREHKARLEENRSNQSQNKFKTEKRQFPYLRRQTNSLRKQKQRSNSFLQINTGMFLSNISRERVFSLTKPKISNKNALSRLETSVDKQPSTPIQIQQIQKKGTALIFQNDDELGQVVQTKYGMGFDKDNCQTIDSRSNQSFRTKMSDPSRSQSQSSPEKTKRNKSQFTVESSSLKTSKRSKLWPLAQAILNKFGKICDDQWKQAMLNDFDTKSSQSSVDHTSGKSSLVRKSCTDSKLNNKKK